MIVSHVTEFIHCYHLIQSTFLLLQCLYFILYFRQPFVRLNSLCTILSLNTCLSMTALRSLSLHSALTSLWLVEYKWEQRVGGGSDWNSSWSNDCKLWKPRGFSNHSWMGWRVNVGRLWSGGERRSENSIVNVALSRALHKPLMVELFWHWMDT